MLWTQGRARTAPAPEVGVAHKSRGGRLVPNGQLWGCTVQDPEKSFHLFGPRHYFETGDNGSPSGLLGLKGRKVLKPKAQSEDGSASGPGMNAFAPRAGRRCPTLNGSPRPGGSQKLRAGRVSPRRRTWAREAEGGARGGGGSLGQSWREGRVGRPGTKRPWFRGCFWPDRTGGSGGPERGLGPRRGLGD